MEKKNTLLDLIISNDYPFLNMKLTKEEFWNLEDYIKQNCFIINREEKEDNWEYKLEYEFLYKAKPILLKRFKSYTSGEEYFLLRCEK
jgi:hypothetical protein